MAVQSKVGSFSTGTGAAATTVAVTGVGFTPNVIILWWSGRTESVTTSGRVTHKRGVGFATGTTSRHAVATCSDHAVATSACFASGRDDACVHKISSTGTDEGRLDFQSFDGDGFTLVVDLAFTASIRISFLAIGGAGNAATEVITASAATGTVDYTSIGFQPTLLMFISSAQTAAPPSTRANSQCMVGWASDSTKNGLVAAGAQDAQATINSKRYGLSPECVGKIINAFTGTSVDGRGALSAFLSNGYRLNWTEADPDGTRWHVLALDGVSATVGEFTTLTDIVTDIVQSGFGFTPTAAMFLSAGAVEATANANADEDRWSLGAGTAGIVQNSQATDDRDAEPTSIVFTAINFANVYLNPTLEADALDGAMELRSLDADGFTTRMTNADPGARWVSYLAIGPPAAAAELRSLMLVGVGQ